MNAPRLIALLAALVLTAGELLSLDYYTARLTSIHTSQVAAAMLTAQR